MAVKVPESELKIVTQAESGTLRLCFSLRPVNEPAFLQNGPQCMLDELVQEQGECD